MICTLIPNPETVLEESPEKISIYAELAKLVRPDSVQRLLEQLAERGIGGGAALSGIPGSVGGALRMNAGANGVEIADFLIEVEYFRNGRVLRVPVEREEWRYRTSPLPEDAAPSFSRTWTSTVTDRSLPR